MNGSTIFNGINLIVQVLSWLIDSDIQKGRKTVRLFDWLIDWLDCTLLYRYFFLLAYSSMMPSYKCYILFCAVIFQCFEAWALSWAAAPATAPPTAINRFSPVSLRIPTVPRPVSFPRRQRPQRQAGRPIGPPHRRGRILPLQLRRLQPPGQRSPLVSSVPRTVAFQSLHQTLDTAKERRLLPGGDRVAQHAACRVRSLLFVYQQVLSWGFFGKSGGPCSDWQSR